jgi:hypothetical protein
VVSIVREYRIFRLVFSGFVVCLKSGGLGAYSQHFIFCVTYEWAH